MKIVGINPIITKKGEKAVILHMTGEFGQRDVQAVGHQADSVFVTADMFDKALEGSPYDKVLGRECRVFYTKSGFVEGITVSK